MLRIHVSMDCFSLLNYDAWYGLLCDLVVGNVYEVEATFTS